MKKAKTLAQLLLCAMAAQLLSGCVPAAEIDPVPQSEPTKILSSVSVLDAAEGEKEYARCDGYTLCVDERNAVFSVEDANGNRWDSIPADYAEDPQARGDAQKLLGSLIQIHYADQLGNINVLSSRKDSVEKGTAVVMKIENGVRMEFRFEKYGFLIPVEILLRTNGIEISLVSADVRENNDSYRLLSVDVAPYFSAARAEQNGYMLVPDGAGALIDWKNAVDISQDYSQYVYGRDAAITLMEQGTLSETVRLPVFGMLHDGTGFTAFLTEGAPRAKLNASVAGKRSSFSNVYSEFIYRDSNLVRIEKKDQVVRIVEPSHTAAPRQSVRYVLMAGPDLDYVDMAAIYRDYLQTEMKVQPVTQQGSAPMVLELFGGVMKQQFVMGFPVDRVVPLTTFEDAGRIISELQAAGVNDLVVSMTQWQKDATGAAIQRVISPEGMLGGKRDLEELLKQCAQKNVSFYLDANINVMAQSAFGFNKKNDAASSVRREPAMQYPYSINTGEAKVSSPIFYLTPKKMVWAANSLAQSASKYSLAGLAASTLADVLYSDFDKIAVTRDQSEQIWQAAMEELKGAAGSLLVSGGNAYALPNASLVMDAPMESSQFLLESRSVPFYQIVLHGLVPMSTTSLNEMANVRRGFLKAVETGTYLKWRWIAGNEEKLRDTDFNYIISARYDNWIEVASSQYAEAGSLLAQLSDCTIVGHEQLEGYEDVVRVRWSDGTTVLINYGASAVSVDGITVEAEAFTVEGGRQ